MKKIYFTLWLLIFIVAIAQSQPGKPDFSFGNRGKILSDFGSDEYATSAALQPDGKIIVAGSYDLYPEDNARLTACALFRYKPNGIIDSSFGINGAAVNAIGNSFSELKAVLSLDNGKILAAGYANLLGYYNQLIVVRYNNKGKIDSSFGDNGVASFSKASYSVVADAMLLQKNKLIVAATAINNEGKSDIILVAFNQAGQIDPAFGTNGKTITSIGDYAGANAITTDKYSRIIVAGFGKPDGLLNPQFAVIRYSVSGIVDAGFGKNGIVVTALQKLSIATDVKATSANKIMVLKYSTTNSITTGEIVRLNEDGKTDISFGNNGSAVTDVFSAMMIQSNGKIITAGSRINPRNSKIGFGLSRFKSNGSIDSTFGENGNAITAFGTAESFANTLLLQPDGKIIATGIATKRNNGLYNQDVAVARYTGDNILVAEAVANNILKQQIKVSPNPVKNIMTIENNVGFLNTEIIISDISGNIIQKEKANTAAKNYTIIAVNLKPDLYNISIKNKDGFVAANFLKE